MSAVIHVSFCECKEARASITGSIIHKDEGRYKLEEPIQASARKFNPNFCHLGKRFSDSSAASGTIFYPCWAMSSSEDCAHFLLNQRNFLIKEFLKFSQCAVYCRFKDYIGSPRCWSTYTHTPPYSILHKGHMLHSCFNLCWFYFQFLSKCFSHFSYELFLEVQTSLSSCIMLLSNQQINTQFNTVTTERDALWKILKLTSSVPSQLTITFNIYYCALFYSIVLNYRIQNN